MVIQKMDPLKAKELLTLLEKKGSEENRYPLNKFVLGLWSSVATVDSLEGRLSLLIHKNKSKKDLETAVKDVFKKVLEAVPKNGESIPYCIGLNKLLKKPSSNLPSSTFAYLQQLEESTQETLQSIREKQLEKCSSSLISREDLSFAETIDNKTLLAVLSGKESVERESFFQAFLERNPQYKGLEKTGLIERSLEAKSISKNRKDLYKAASSLEEKNSTLNTLAEEMFLSLQGLNPGKRSLYIGSYGQEDTFSFLAEKFETLFPSVNPENIKNPKLFLEELLQKNLTPSTENFQNLKALLENPIIAAFFPNKNRTFPKVGFIEEILQQGILSVYLDFIPDGDFREKALDFLKKTEAFFENPEQEILDLKKIKTIEDITSQLDFYLEKTNEIKKVLKLVPKPVLNMLDPNHKLVYGPLWVDFLKEPHGTYTISIYGLGEALENHPEDRKTKKITWPLLFKNIAPERITEDFCKRLLSYQLDPSLYKNPKNLYSSVFSYLQGESYTDSNTKILSPSLVIEGNISEIVRLSSNKAPSLAFFMMDLEATVSFCRTLSKDSDSLIKIESPEIYETLKKAKEALSVGLFKNRLFLHEKTILELESTLLEIDLSIFSFEEKQNLAKQSIEDAFFQFLKGNLENKDGSIEYLRSIKGTVSDLFGQECADCLDMFLDTLNDFSVEAEKTILPQQEKKLPRGALGRIFSHSYMPIALAGLQIAMALFLLYKSPVVLASSFVFLGIKYLTPLFIKEWFAVFLKEAKKQVLFMIVSNSGKIKPYQASIEKFAKRFLGNETLRYVLSEKIEDLETVEETPPRFSVEKEIRLPNLFIKTAEEIELENLALTIEDPIELLNTYLELSENRKYANIINSYLSNEIEKLEPPTKGIRGYWDEIDNIEKTISILLNVQTKIESVKDQTVNSFTILTIVDTLARRLPNSQLAPYKTGASALLIYLKKYAYIPGVNEAEKTEKILSYFFEGVSLDNLPSFKEIEELSENALFDCFSDKTKKPLEFSYLEEVMAAPSFAQKLKKFFDPSLVSGSSFDALSEEDKIDFLHYEATLFRKDPLIPLEYSAIYCCSQVAKKGALNKLHVKFFSKAVTDLNERRYRSNYPFQGDILRGVLKETKELSQSELMSLTQTAESLEMVRSEPTDTIVRVLTYYKKNPECFFDWTVEYFKKTLIYSGALLSQLKKAPGLGSSLGEFLTFFAQEFTRKPHALSQWIFFLEIGFCLKEYCKRHTPTYLNTFPDFKKVLFTLKGTEKILFRDLFATFFEKINDGSLSLEEQEEGLLCLYIQSLENERSYSNGFKKWQSLLEKALLKPSFLEKIRGFHRNENKEKTSSSKTDQQTSKIKDELLFESLPGLQGFCSLSKINAFGRVGFSQILDIEIPSFDLHFIVEPIKNELEACSKEFPGYFLSKHQIDKTLPPLLQGELRYLLLQNSTGSKKVLIPNKQEASSFTSSILKKTAFLAKVAAEPFIDSNSYFVYDLDTTQEILTSEDPKALAYLLSLYILNKDEKGITQTCFSLELLLRRTPISDKILKHLYILFLHPSFFNFLNSFLDMETISLVRRKIFSALEENALVQITPNKKIEKSKNKTLHLFYIATAYQDLQANLKEKDPRKKMDDYQEWFLYEGLLARVESLCCIPENFDMSFFSESLVFSEDLLHRYKELKGKFQLKDSKKTVLAQSATRAITQHITPNLGGTVIPLEFLEIALGFCYPTPSCDKIDTDFSPDCPLNLKEVTKETFKKNFLTYYAIARGNGSLEEQIKLKDLLLLLEGGFNQETAAFIECLKLIMRFPSYVEDPIVLQKILQKKNQNKLDWKDFISSLLRKVTQQKILDLAKEQVLSTGAQIIKKTPGLLLISLLNPSRLAEQSVGALAHSASSLVLQTKETYNELANLKPARFKEGSFIKSSYEHLVEKDASMDGIFENLFSLSFEIQGFDEVTATPFFRFKGHANLWDLYQTLTFHHEVLSSQLAEEKTKLLQIVNTSITKTQMFTPITLEDLLSFFLKGELTNMKTLSGFSIATLEILDKALSHFFLRNTRLQQLTRCARHLQELTTLDKEKQKISYDRKLEELAQELQARRGYDFRTLPPSLARKLLVFELSTNVLLWDKQVGSIARVLSKQDKGSGAIFELLMSYGKTFFCIPTMDAFMADGKNIVFNVWPTPLVETNTRQIGVHGYNALRQKANRLHFHRNLPFSIKNLQATLIILQRALELGETNNLSKEDVEALELLFIEELHGTKKNLAVQFGKILNMMRSRGIVIGDEVHELFDDKQELNHPLGKRQTIPLRHYEAVETVMKKIMSHEEFPFLISLESRKKAKKRYEEYVLPDLARKLSYNYKWRITSEKQREELITYVSGKALKTPDWISSSEAFVEISMCKGVLSILVPAILAKKVNVDFGIPLQGKEKYAIPYEGNNSPLEKATCKSPYEALVKTFIMYSKTGLSDSQTNTVIKALKLLNQELLFEKITGLPSISAFDSLTEPQRNIFLDSLAFNQEAISFYIKKNVFTKIPYWKYNICSDPQNFSSQFFMQYYDTGTPYNVGNYPGSLTLELDPTSIPRAIAILKKKCPSNGIHVLISTSPLDILHEVIHSFFFTGSNFTALIDGGAQFCGIDNKTVAKTMLEYVAGNRLEIKGINFFDKDAAGKEILVTLELGAEQPIPYDQSSLKPEQTLSYFDQKHGFGANIPQKFNAKGLLLLGSDHLLYKLLQESFRMRGVKDFKKILERDLSPEEFDLLNLKETQSIHFAMTDAVRQEITENEIPCLEEILQYATTNQEKLLKKSNYNSYRKKVRNILRNKAIEKILSKEPLGEKAMKDVFEKCRDLFISVCEDDPRKLYGATTTKLPARTVLHLICESTIKKSRKTDLFKEEEIQEMQIALDSLEKHPMEEEIEVALENGELNVDILDDLIGKEVFLDSEQEQEQNTQQTLYMPNKEIPKFKETSWLDTFDPYSLDWQNFHHPEELSWLSRWSTPIWKNQQNPIFKVADLLSASSESSLKELRFLFDEKMWYSNNFLPQEGCLWKTEISTPPQRALFEVLIHFIENQDGIDIVSIGALSMSDAAIWRKKLNSKAGTGTIRAVLYDVELRTSVAGSSVDISKLRNSFDLHKYEALFKFLNGDVDYTKEQILALKTLLTPEFRASFYDAFHFIYEERSSKSLLGTPMDILLEYLNVM